MIPNNVAEQLYTRLIDAAKRRHSQGIEVIPAMKFDDFIKVVQRLGQLSVELGKEGVNLAHMGMGMDYYARAIGYMIDESAKLEKSPVAGSA